MKSSSVQLIVKSNCAVIEGSSVLVISIDACPGFLTLKAPSSPLCTVNTSDPEITCHVHVFDTVVFAGL